MIDIAAIRASVDLVALVQRRIPLKKSGKDFYGRCPFHDEKSASFAVIPNQRRFYCHGCGAHGDALDFVMQTEGVTLTEAAARLGGKEADPETKRRLEAETRKRERLAADTARRERVISEYRDRNPDCCVPDWALEA